MREGKKGNNMKEKRQETEIKTPTSDDNKEYILWLFEIGSKVSPECMSFRANTAGPFLLGFSMVVWLAIMSASTALCLSGNSTKPVRLRSAVKKNMYKHYNFIFVPCFYWLKSSELLLFSNQDMQNIQFSNSIFQAHSHRRVNITIPQHWPACEWTGTLPIFPDCVN